MRERQVFLPFAAFQDSAAQVPMPPNNGLQGDAPLEARA